MKRAAFFSVLLFSLAACAESNPIDWGKSTFNTVFGGEAPPEAEPPAAEGRPYPNLATVPRRPRDPPGAKAQREADLAQLTRDRDTAMADDQALRDTGAMPVRSPDSEAAAPVVSPAPAAPAPSRQTQSAPPVAPSSVAVAAPQSVPLAAPAPAPAPAGVAPQRVGSVGFGRDTSSLTANGQRSLAEAAALARAGNGRVHLVVAQTSHRALSVDQVRARLNAITQALAAAGIPASRVTIDDALGQRIDLYDVYVER